MATTHTTERPTTSESLTPDSSAKVHVEEALTINRPAAELYDYWRHLENLPHIMSHLESVRVLDATRSHWIIKGPGGMNVEWDAKIINDEPGRLIAWQSLPDAQVENAGSVRFNQTDDRGTQVNVVLNYAPPAGRVGSLVAKLFGKDPAQQVREDLRHFKQVMEAGESPTTEGQPRGTCGKGDSKRDSARSGE